MSGKEKLELLVEGGKASPDPNSAQKLGAYKMNIGDVFKKVNEKTSVYKGMQVPVKVIIDKDTKDFDVEVGIPPVSSMIKKEAGVELAKITEEDKTSGKTVLGSVSMEQCVKIAKMKIDGMLVKDLKNAVKQVIGTAVSMQGIQVEKKSPKEALKEIEDGKWDSLFN